MSFNSDNLFIDRINLEDSIAAYNIFFADDDREEEVDTPKHIFKSKCWSGNCATCRAQKIKKINQENWAAVATTVAIGLCGWVVLIAGARK